MMEHPWLATSSLSKIGSGVITRLPEIVEENAGRSVLLVVGPGCAPVAETVRGLLGDRWVGDFTDAVAHVSAWEANLAVASAQEVHADTVISLGGGSAAGYAKIVALALNVPWIAVATTLSGAEMTSRYLVSTENGKESGSSERTVARAVLRDVDLLGSVPPPVLASSGMTALAACVESLASGHPEAHDEAERGLRLLWSALPSLLATPDRAEPRLMAHLGAELAGRALEIAGPGPAQLVAEDLGARHRCDHGALLACLLPRVARASAVLAELAGDGAPGDLVTAFAERLGLPTELSEVCPYPDARALVNRLAAREDVAVAAEELHGVLGEAAA
jgi:maleylacetate reductase